MNIHKEDNMDIHKIKQKIISIAREERVITTSEIAEHFGISWNTAEKYLLELTIDGKIIRKKKQGVNLWLPA
ncbi:DUF977 family protein [Candidatus Woesearchaeota archaeon]|nr:DUF977 family protein [Candidatus Woesearchaeota archaeon]